MVQFPKVANPIEAVRDLTPERRGSDVVIEAVGRPEAWEWAIDMVRKGGTVNLFGGCAKGTRVALNTERLHYSEITSEGDVPSHSGHGAAGVCADRRAQDQGRGLHHRGSAAVQIAIGVAGDGGARRRDQDRDHSWTLKRLIRPAFRLKPVNASLAHGLKPCRFDECRFSENRLG